MSRKEQVDRVLSAVVHHEYAEGEGDTRPLISTGEEYWFTSEEALRKWITRILAAADGVTEFTDPYKPYVAPKVRHTKPRNLAAHEAYKKRRRDGAINEIIQAMEEEGYL